MGAGGGGGGGGVGMGLSEKTQGHGISPTPTSPVPFKRYPVSDTYPLSPGHRHRGLIRTCNFDLYSY